MTLEQFESTVRPRVTGTINLHLATRQSPLDFFMMWSSWTAVFGNPTQANYLSSCAFMDAFAHYRRSLGLPAVSLSLSRIGSTGQWAETLSPHHAQALTRNGFYTNSEEDFLQYCESALDAGRRNGTWQADPLATAHLLAGIEPQGLRKLNITYPLKDMAWYCDERFSNLLQAVDILSARDNNNDNGASQESCKEEERLSTTNRIHKKLADLLYMSHDDVDITKPLSEHGIDSMIAGELRNWVFQAFGKDMSMFRLLSPAMTVERLSIEVEAPD